MFIPKFISQLLYLRCSSQHGHHGMFYVCCDILQEYSSVVWDRGTFAFCKLSSHAAYERSLAPIAFTCKPRCCFFWSKQFAYDVSKDCLVSSRPLKPLTIKVFTFTHKNNTTWWFNVILSSPSGRSLMPGTCLFQPKQTSQNELPLEGLVIGQTWHLNGRWRFSFPFGT